ncbi:hypothetical protein EST38_g4541 [Candolleomyces aberdarensis]|uniref:Aromatic-L-amino-acid decarboxylase n=1 Tax=Candolleomyces aberdarensis TaxID=2316362 RepID=A0A4Q2DR10_9AGAR|nr:hypothetical protein EST38_g4541 [Candolleomyces aberdarensis]
MDIEQFRKAGYAAIDRICDYFYSLEKLPVTSKVEPGYLRKLIPDEAPENGEDFTKIADDVKEMILPGLTRWQHPSFFAYFPTACTFEGILGDLYSSSLSNPGFNWSASPACTELEVITMDWAAKLLGLAPAFYNASEVGGGVIQTSASDVVLVAVVAARSRFQRDHPDTKVEDMVIYATTQTHSLAKKAAIVLSLQVRSIEVKSEDQYALRGDSLRAALEEDAKLGRKPFILIATVGTTSSGAVDNVVELAAVLKDYPDIWFHIDAAWAGVALACPEFREQLYLPEINESATSVCANFHKWGLVNFDCSAMWVRDRRLLTDALDVTPIIHDPSDLSFVGTAIDYRNWHLGLGRRFRSIKLWFVLRSYGIAGFQRHIRKTIDMNNLFVKLLSESKVLTLFAEPSLALTVFRITPPEGVDKFSAEALSDLNARFFKVVSARDDIMLTQTSLNGHVCIRFAVGSARTEENHIKQAYEIVEQEAAKVIETWRQHQS